MSIQGLAAAQASIDALRGLAIDATERANSGHPGLPLGAAPMAYVLWRHHLSHAPRSPTWPNRDRFVLSAGHGSALLYGLLHLSGYDLTTDDLRAFRQLHSRTPGHPEPHLTPGVEVVTGPLGQGAAASVGLALAERCVAERFVTPNHEAVVDHRTWALLSDGDVMEGICYEAAALAGHLRLHKLTWLYDSNDVTLDGPLSESSGEDVAARFVALGWHVQTVADGDHDLDAIDAALSAAKRETRRPSLVIVRTTIGFGAPHKAGSSAAHGAPLGAAEAAATKAALGLPSVGSFDVAPLARTHMQALTALGEQRVGTWHGELAAYQQAHPEQGAALERLHAHGPTEGIDWQAPLPVEFDKPISTRQASQRAIAVLADALPALMGGDGDISASTLSKIPAGAAPGAQRVRNIHYGVREHAMAAITNGLAAHGGLLPFAATFFAFSDYMRPALRLAAMARLGVVWIWTHDSVALGEDGPTHQPIEQLASLRAMPHMTVLRPADGAETVAAWALCCQRIAAGHGPHGLVLTRQTLPLLPRAATLADVARGAYVVADSAGAEPELVLLGTGSEVHVALRAAQSLRADGVDVRVVSMPSWDVFEAAGVAYQRQVLGSDGTPRVSVEAAATFGWHRWLGARGRAVGIDRFGLSAPGDAALSALGITPAAVVQAAREAMAAKLG